MRMMFAGAVNECLAVAFAKMRSARRIVRTWVFVALGLGAMIGAYLYYSDVHASNSTAFIGAGYSQPRFTAAYSNSCVLWFFMVAVVFLAFDMRRRDEREHMAEVLDARPFSSISLVGGWLLPLPVALATIQTLGMVGQAAGWH